MTTSIQSTTREVFTGKWEVFNDPFLDPRIIPDDPMEREWLRNTLLVSTWYNNKGIMQLKIDYQEVLRYYYTEHNQKDGMLRFCTGAMIGSSRIFVCWNMTKEDIDKHDTYGTLQFLIDTNGEAFYSDMVILPIVCIIGVTGIHSVYLTSDLKTPFYINLHDLWLHPLWLPHFQEIL